MVNQNPEQIARDIIDKQLSAFGWIIQGINNYYKVIILDKASEERAGAKTRKITLIRQLLR